MFICILDECLFVWLLIVHLYLRLLFICLFVSQVIVYLFDKVLTQEAAVDVLLPGGWALHLYQHISYINALSYINIHMCCPINVQVFSFLSSSCWRARLLSSFLVISIYADILSQISQRKDELFIIIIMKSKKLLCTTIQRMKDWYSISFQQILKASAILLSVQRRQPES